MRVVLAPDSFTGTASAAQAAEAFTAGWRTVAAGDELVAVPLSDGGPGFVEALGRGLVQAGQSTETVSLSVAGPAGRPVDAEILVSGGTAYVESAMACGLHLLAADERDPSRTTTAGVGALLAAAAERHDVRRIVVGLGGSGTSDGGAGCWHALGREGRARLRALELVAATDVDNPLLGPNGASAVFGPQKGADRAMVLDLDDRLRRWADEVESDTGGTGLRDRPGAGAAGGLGFALLALGARRGSGFDVVAEAVGLTAEIERSDLVLTGEGSFDAQTLGGKVAAGVARLAQAAGVPCVVVAGRVEVGRRDAAAAGVDETYAVADLLGSPEAALAAGVAGIRDAAGLAARQWAARG